MSLNVSISVVMPAYNEELWISESIQSILNQTFEDFELIVVDDGSTDNTFKIATSFNDPRVKVYRQENMGPATARNKALNLAKGKYIALQDADDRSKPGRLELQYEFLENNINYVAVGVFADYIDKDGLYIYQHNRPEIIPEDWDWLQTPLIHPSVMFRRHVLKKVGGYPDIPVSQDTLFLYNISKCGKFKNLPHSLFEYRVNPFAISRKNKALKRAVRQLITEYYKTNEINEELLKEIKQKKSEQSQQNKFYNYHILLAKKYLWNNYNKKKSREHCVEAIKYGKLIEKIPPIMLYSVSYFGEINVRIFYERFLNR